MKMKDLGDFQTPPALVAAVLNRLGPVGRQWRRVLEPTCGRGHFLAGLLALDPPPAEVHGIEIQAEHVTTARALAGRAPANVQVGVTQGDFFAMDLRRALAWTETGPLLVVGNPPWVTSAALGVLGSGNGPARCNVNGATGLEAKTGASNFDLAEAVWLKLLTELHAGPATIALLCKLSVARRVLEHAAATGMAVAAASLVRIDTRAWFDAAVEACLLCVTLGPGTRAGWERIPVFADLEATEPASFMGFARGRLVADLETYAPLAFADGVCPLTWRQGLKHDAASVVELQWLDDEAAFCNRRGEPVDVEPEHVYPWLKATDLARPGHRPARAVIVTQRKVGDDTRPLAHSAPRLWGYLERHAVALAARKSSVYRGQPPYAMFGVGPYTFADWKVAVSGLHPSALFRCLGPEGGRPVLLDDTCYFVACWSPEQAALVAAVANLPRANALLRALSFPGSKRPVTKALLQRLALRALLTHADRPAVLARAGADVARLAGRAARWPDAPEELLETQTRSKVSD